MKSMMKDAAILFVITLISGLLLGVVYEVTKEPIAVQEALRKNKACQEVFQDAANFETLELSAPHTIEPNQVSKRAAARDIFILLLKAVCGASGLRSLNRNFRLRR